jgi:hypothetical protein
MAIHNLPGIDLMGFDTIGIPLPLCGIGIADGTLILGPWLYRRTYETTEHKYTWRGLEGSNGIRVYSP